jgi:hypothetical protein
MTRCSGEVNGAYVSRKAPRQVTSASAACPSRWPSCRGSRPAAAMTTSTGTTAARKPFSLDAAAQPMATPLAAANSHARRRELVNHSQSSSR